MTASQHMIQAGRLRFRALVAGPPTGELVLMLHGFPEGAESWSAQLDAVADAGYLAVAPDMRGYGMSDAPPSVDEYAIDHLVEDTENLIRAFGRSEAHIVGHDWGALVAWFFASRRPLMTKTLTALSVGHPGAVVDAARSDPDQRERSRYIVLFLQEGKAEEVLAADGMQRLRAMFAMGPNPAAVPRAVVDHFAGSLARPGRLTAALNYYRANFGRGAAWAALANQVEVWVPTTLIWGDGDPALGRVAVDATASLMRGPYELAVLEGAGHWLQHERPTEVARWLMERLIH